MKFPVVLRDKLMKGEIELPDDAKFFYKPIKANRCIKREQDDFSPVTADDFKSYAELRRKGRRGRCYDVNSPNYYGVSCFRKKELVENLMGFPNPHKKMAVGLVFCQGGPQQTNEATEHVCWWLFENVDLSNFAVMKGGQVQDG